MELKPSRERPHAYHGKGLGRFYVDGRTARILNAGFVGWLVSIPIGIVAIGFLGLPSKILLGLLGAFGFVGWLAGLVVGALRFKE